VVLVTKTRYEWIVTNSVSEPLISFKILIIFDLCNFIIIIFFQIEEAKAMYRKFEKITFQFDHCWNILRKVPKWNSHKVQMKLRRKLIGTSSPSTPEAIHLWEDNDVENVFVDCEKPLGKKTSEERERKRKSKDSHTLNTMDVLSKLKEGKMISYEERNKQIYTENEEIILVEKQKLEIEQRKEEREQRKEEWEIMMMDTSNLSPMQQEYIHLRQMEILEKRRSK
jgi:ribosomal protein L32